VHYSTSINVAMMFIPKTVAGIIKTSGLNRISMSGPELFAKHGRHCKDLYGFPDFEYMKCFIERMLGVEYVRPSKPFVTAGGRQNNGLGEFEQVLLTLLFTNTYWNYDVLGSIFGVATRQTVKKYIDKWLPLLGELGDMLSSFSDILDADVHGCGRNFTNSPFSFGSITSCIS